MSYRYEKVAAVEQWNNTSRPHESSIIMSMNMAHKTCFQAWIQLPLAKDSGSSAQAWHTASWHCLGPRNFEKKTLKYKHIHPENISWWTILVVTVVWSLIKKATVHFMWLLCYFFVPTSHKPLQLFPFISQYLHNTDRDSCVSKQVSILEKTIAFQEKVTETQRCVITNKLFMVFSLWWSPFCHPFLDSSTEYATSHEKDWTA